MFNRLILSALVLAPCALGAVDHVWIEGEKPSAGGSGLTTTHHFDSPHAELSGGVSLGGSASAGLFLEYEIDAPSAGAYEAFVRRFWNHGPFRWRLGQGEWRELGEGDFLQESPLTQHVISWLPLGTVTLATGKQVLRIEALKSDGPFVIDCLAFVKGPFNPAGVLRPGEKFARAEPGTWAFEPEVDDHRRDALDLRGLNERVAGESGRIQVDAKGDFIDGRGKPIRFWSGVTWLMERKGTAMMTPHAKHLAKRGVNMVRAFAFLNPKDNGGRGMQPDAKEIDEAQKAVAFMKREGIYTTLCPYWAGFADAAPQATLFWDETLQREYKAWVKELLTRPNPYDEQKTPLGRDPAMAIFQIQNEDSLFFWTTLAVLKDQALEKITTRYHAWRTQNKLPGSPALSFRFWEMAQPNQDHKDSMRFFAELQRAWNVEVERFLRAECDCQALVNSGNWRTADQLHLLDLDRWSTSANGVIGNNRYINNVHVNPGENHKAGYMVSVGDLFVDQSKIMDWPALATNARQVVGKAYIVPESTWVPPGSYLSEGPLLVAAYSALTGVDAFYWFSLGSVGYDSTLNKWQTATPSVMGGWPAASLMFRNGLVARGAPALHEERALADLWNLSAPLLGEEAGFDPNRDANISPRSNIATAVDPAAYLVGPVEVAYGGDPAKSKVMDLAPFVDQATGRITSNTREISLDPRTGLCLVQAPAAQGATGFLARAGRIELGALTIESRCAYATVLAVALDSKPLAASQRVLLQVTTQHRAYGWKQSPATFTHEKQEYKGFRIDSLGTLPWNVVDTDMTLTLANPGLRTVTRLDENLYPTGDAVDVVREVTGLRITPPRNTMYLLVE